MTDEQFAALVARIETLGREHPARYKFRVALLAVLAHAYIGLVLALTLGLAGGLVLLLLLSQRIDGLVAYVVMLLLVFAAAIVRALWVRFAAPLGRVITAAEAPELFRLIDEVRVATGGQEPHHVLLTDDLNAGVTSVPRLGVLGWNRRYLVLGLPLLAAVSPDELRAILAHEFGHVVGDDSRFGAWVCRVRATWARLVETLSQRRGWGMRIFSRFLEWWWPRFDAWSFVLARAQEYRADQLAARVAGARVATDALVRVELAARGLSEEFWPSIHARAADEPHPAVAPFGLMTASLRHAAPAGDPQALLRSFLARGTDALDTHPALADRCRALGQEPRLPPPPTSIAADELLGPLAGTIAAEFDARWREANAPAWAEEHARLITARNELAVLEAEAGRRALDQDELLARAHLVADLSGRQAARPLYEEALARDESHAAARFHAARIRLEMNDDAGVALMEDAIARDDGYTLPGCEALFGYWMRQGRRDEAAIIRRRFQERQELQALADHERAHVWPELDRYQQHGLPEEVVARVRVILEHDSDIGLAVLVGRRLSHLPQHPAFLLAVIRKPGAFERATTSARLDGLLGERLAARLELPGRVLVHVVSYQRLKLVRNLAAKFPDSVLVTR